MQRSCRGRRSRIGRGSAGCQSSQRGRSCWQGKPGRDRGQGDERDGPCHQQLDVLGNVLKQYATLGGTTTCRFILTGFYADPKKPLNRHDAVRLSSRRSQGRQGCDVSNSRPKNAKTSLWGIQEFRSFPPISHFGLGVPGTQRRRWVSLAVENFGLGFTVLAEPIRAALLTPRCAVRETPQGVPARLRGFVEPLGQEGKVARRLRMQRPFYFAVRRNKSYRDRYQLMGRTISGRRLKIIFQLKPGNVVRIITGWPI